MISLIGYVPTNQINPATFIEVTVLIQDRECSCICVLRLSIVPLSTTFYCILELFPRCCIFVCYGCRLFLFLRLSIVFQNCSHGVVYLCVMVVDCSSFYDFLLYSRTVPTVLYICVLRLSIVPLSTTFYCILELFPRCCIFVCYGCRLFLFLRLSIVFQNCSHGVVYLCVTVVDCSSFYDFLLYSRTVSTVLYICVFIYGCR